MKKILTYETRNGKVKNEKRRKKKKGEEKRKEKKKKRGKKLDYITIGMSHKSYVPNSTLCIFFGSRTVAPEKIVPNPNSKPNPKPNPNPNQGAIFLEGN